MLKLYDNLGKINWHEKMNGVTVNDKMEHLHATIVSELDKVASE